MPDRFRVGFCVSGGGRLFRAALAQRESLAIDPVMALGGPKVPSELDAICTAHGLPFKRLDPKADTFRRDLCRSCIDAHVDLLVLTYDRLVPPELVEHYRGRIINVHPALLPAFKGYRGIQQAIDGGARVAGATIHEVDEYVDNGPTIAQCVVGLRQNDTPELVGARMFGLMRLMYLQTIAWFAQGRVHKDSNGNVWVRGAVYGELPICPSIEQGFPD